MMLLVTMSELSPHLSPRRFAALRSTTLPLVAALALIVSSSCSRVDAVPAIPEEREAETLLAEYVRADTTNPPGNETRGAVLLQKKLQENGIEASLVGSNPARQSVYARLTSGSSAPALLLLHHIDVVPANAAEWSMPPFGGVRSGGYLWGRGALDNKSLGVAGLIAFLDLRRRGLPLTRDVIFLGVAGEETGGAEGCAKLLAERAELFQNVGFVLNEGGSNETIVDRVSSWGIEVHQKVPLWLRLTMKGSGGHGSTPPDNGGSTMRLIAAVSRIAAEERPLRLVPEVTRYFKALAPAKRGEKAFVLARIDTELNSPRLRDILSPSYRALLQDTFAVTRLDAGTSVNSIPTQATAELDLRLLPDADPDRTLARLREIAGEGSEIQVLLKGEASPPSPIDTPLYESLSRVLTKREPGSIAIPSVTPGTSDSRFFRQRGIVAYGFSPFKVNYYDADTVHAPDERIRLRFFAEGVRVMRAVVQDFCTRPR